MSKLHRQKRLAVGATLGGYRIEGQLGEGGMGVVYQAVQLSLKRPVALKLLTTELAFDQESRERFVQEGILAARIQHPNVVRVLEVGEVEHRLFIAYELISEPTLRYRLDRDVVLPVETAIDIAHVCADVLAMLHESGILHRDLKPENIFHSDERGPLVADLGIAKDLMTDSVSTRQGFILGTPAYMAPELGEGKPASAASDLYALATVLFECLCGRTPYQSKDPHALLRLQMQADIPPISQYRSGLPSGFDRFFRRALAKNRKERFKDARGFQRGLKSARSGRSESIDRTVLTDRSIKVPSLAPVTVHQPASQASSAKARGEPRPPAWILPAFVFALVLTAAGVAAYLRTPAAPATAVTSAGTSPEAPSKAAEEARAEERRAEALRIESSQALQSAMSRLATVGRETHEAHLANARDPKSINSGLVLQHLFESWRRSIPPVQQALRVLGELAGTGDREAPVMAGRLLLEVFLIYDFGKIQVWDDLTAHEEAKDPAWSVFGFLSLSSISSGLQKQVSKEAMGLLKTLPKELIRSDSPVWQVGFLGLRALSRYALHPKDIKTLSSDVRLRTRNQIPDLELRGTPGPDELTMLSVLLRTLVFMGSKKPIDELTEKVFLRFEGISRTALLHPGEELALYELHRARARVLLYTNVSENDRYDKLEEQLAAWTTLRDRLIRRWPFDPREPPPPGAGGAAVDMLDMQIRRLEECRSLARISARKSDHDVPPEPKR